MTKEEVEQTEEVEAVEQAEETNAEGTIAEEVETAADEVGILQQKLKEAEDKFLRVHADFDNIRRRMQQEAEKARKYHAQDLVAALLPALDNFERAMKVEAVSDETKAVLQGMEMIYNQIQAVLKEEGVEIIEAVDKPFDPNFHQAVLQVDEGHESGQVIEEFQKGYLLHDRVIRPSMVKVNQ